MQNEEFKLLRPTRKEDTRPTQGSQRQPTGLLLPVSLHSGSMSGPLRFRVFCDVSSRLVQPNMHAQPQKSALIGINANESR